MAESKSASLPLADAPTYVATLAGQGSSPSSGNWRSQELAQVRGQAKTKSGKWTNSGLCLFGMGHPRAGILDLREIGFQNLSLDDFPGGLIERMSDILERTVFAPLAGHGHEQACGTTDHLEITNDETIVEHDRDVGFEFFFVDGEYLNLGDFHDGPRDSKRASALPYIVEEGHKDFKSALSN